MRVVYPLLWSRLSREAGREQTLNTVAALGRHGCGVTLLAPRRPSDPVLRAEEVAAYFDVPENFAFVQRDWRWVSPQALPSVLWLRRALRDPLVCKAEVLLSRIPAMLAGGWASPIPFATDHYRPWPDDLPVLRPLIRRTARAPLCLGTILHSDFAAESYRRCGVPTEQLLVAHNGADLSRFEPRLSPVEARRALGLEADRPTVVYAGRINRTKGLDQVLALADLRPEVAFVLVGSEQQGSIERAAWSRANVRVVPWQEPRALPTWLYAADVLIVPPSRAPLERFGNCVLPLKLFAYLAAGRPILAPRSPDTVGLLRNGENACLIEPERPEAAAEALDRLLGDAALAGRLGQASRRDAEASSWDARAARVAAFLSARLATVRNRATERSRRSGLA